MRLQLAEQAKCLESRLDNHVSMLKELFDFFKKRAEVERDYSNSMDKLVQQALNRHEKEKQRYNSVIHGDLRFQFFYLLGNDSNIYIF